MPNKKEENGPKFIFISEDQRFQKSFILINTTFAKKNFSAQTTDRKCNK